MTRNENCSLTLQTGWQGGVLMREVDKSEGWGVVGGIISEEGMKAEQELCCYDQVANC